MYLRGQWTIQRNDAEKINQVWRQCGHLGAELQKELGYKVSYLRQMEVRRSLPPSSKRPAADPHHIASAAPPHLAIIRCVPPLPHRDQASGRRSFPTRFLSAEGCYSWQAAQQKLRIKVTYKQARRGATPLAASLRLGPPPT